MMKQILAFLSVMGVVLAVSASAGAQTIPSHDVLERPLGHQCGTLGMRQFVPAPKTIAPLPPRQLGMMPLVGDTRQFWTYDLSVMPPKNKAIQATCRGVGTFVAIWVGDAEWETQVTQTDVDAVLASMETTTPSGKEGGVFANNTSLFGMPPVLMEGDPALTILIYKIPGYQGNVFDGYFRAEDLAPFNASCQTSPMIYCSNELPMIHVTSTDVGSDYMAGVIAHEFEHLIHYGADMGEEPWLDESLAELAMIHAGYNDPGNLAYFLAHPESSLIIEPPVDYGACLLFGSLLWEWLGDEGIASLVADPANGQASVVTALLPNDVTWPMLFGEFSMANLMDFDGPEWPKDHSLVKVEGLAVGQWGEDSANKEVTVPPTATRYYRITPAIAGKALYFDITGSSEMQVYVWNGGLLATNARFITLEEAHALIMEEDLDKGMLYVIFSNPTGTAQSVTFSGILTDPPVVEPAPEPVENDIVSQPDSISQPDLSTTDTLVPVDTLGQDDATQDTASTPDTDTDTDAKPKESSSGGCSTSTSSPASTLVLLLLLLSLSFGLLRLVSRPRLP